MPIGTYISIITLSINGLVHQPIWTDQMDTKTRPIYMLPTGDPLQPQRHIQTERKGQEKIFHVKGNQKKAGAAILISDKIDFKIKITKDKDRHYIMVKRSIPEEDITPVYTLLTGGFLQKLIYVASNLLCKCILKYLQAIMSR